MATQNRFDTLRQDALGLSESDRATLARDLVASLDGPGDSDAAKAWDIDCLLYTSPSPRDRQKSRMPSSA